MGRGEAGRGLKQRLVELGADLDRCMLRDRRRLAGWLERLSRSRRDVDPREVERLSAQVAASVARCEQRRASMPAIRYDESLPVHALRAQIATAIREHPVVIVSGATGSGKSTQLPKICLEIGRGAAGMIGHTQPRRIAAQSLAQRIAAETGTSVGQQADEQSRYQSTKATGNGIALKLNANSGMVLKIN